MLEDVKPGDKLIFELGKKPDSRRIVIVDRLTPKRIVVEKRQFYFDGREVGGTSALLRKPLSGEVKEIERMKQRKEEQVQREQEARRAKYESPGYMEADFLTGLGSLTTEELLKRHDVKTIIKAARLLGYGKS